MDILLWTAQNPLKGALATVHSMLTGSSMNNKRLTRGISSSLVSNSMGTQSPTLTTLSISLTIGQPVMVGDALALVPSLGDEAHIDCSLETTPQQLIDNFLGMQLSIPRPVNGMLKDFNFPIRDYNPSFQNLPLSNNVSIKPHFTSSSLPFPSLVECSLHRFTSRIPCFLVF
jgi:hypothetical protein